MDIVEPGLTGFLNDNLELATRQCLTLDRADVETASLQWTWAECWHIFEENLVDCSVA